MADFSKEEVDGWIEAVNNLYSYVESGPSDARTAAEAMANVWSGFGYLDPTEDVLRMLITATEAGYMAALKDLRDGDLDDEIREWRLDELSEE